MVHLVAASRPHGLTRLRQSDPHALVGALGVSIAFVNSVAPDDPKLTLLLALSWIAFALSLLFILTAYLTGIRSLRRDMRIGPGAAPDEGGWFGRLTQVLNIVSAVALWVGVALLISFALYNI